MGAAPVSPFKAPSTLGLSPAPTSPTKPGGLSSFSMTMPSATKLPSTGMTTDTPTDNPDSLFGGPKPIAPPSSTIDIWKSKIGSGPMNPTGPVNMFGPNIGPKTPQGIPIPKPGPPDIGIKAGDPGGLVNPSPNTIIPAVDIKMGKPPAVTGMDWAPTPTGMGDMGPPISDYRGGAVTAPTGMTVDTPPAPEVIPETPETPRTGVTEDTPIPSSAVNSDPNDLNALLGGKYKDLLNGKNPAMEQAERIALNAMGGLQKSSTSEAAAKAARMGLAPGTPGYEQIMDEARNGVSSAGSGLLSGLAQKGLDSQSQTMTQAGEFQSRQDVIGSKKTQDQIAALDNIINNPDSYSTAQVAQAKTKRAGLVGAGAGGAPDPSDSDMAIKGIMDTIRNTPAGQGLTDGQLRTLAIKRAGTLDDATMNGYIQSLKDDPTGTLAATSGATSDDDWLAKFNKMSKKINPLLPDWANAATWF